MFLWEFCGDIHPRHMFGTVQQAAPWRRRVGQATVEVLPILPPARSDPFSSSWKTSELPCQRMPTQGECERQIAESESLMEKVSPCDPDATRIGRYHQPDLQLFTATQRVANSRVSLLREL